MKISASALGRTCNRRLAWLAGAITMLILSANATTLHAQEPRQCLLEFEARGSVAPRTNAIKLPSERYNVFQGGGVTYHCQGQGNSLSADSAEYYGDESVLLMIGNVRYSETRAKVDSDRMMYYQLEDRLHADGNVNVRLQSGTTMKGPAVDYFRVTATRPLARTVATGRPRMSLVPSQATAGRSDPVDVVANTIVAEGDNLVYASGVVEITRPDVIAKGDSAFLDGQREFARLMREPSVESRRDRPFTLRGGVIDLYSRNKKLERVVATPSGHALSQDLELVADSVDLRIRDDQLERVMAWGKTSRARALSPDREIIADSIDARMPGQRLREVRAVGGAYANSAPDSLRIASTERDWMRGNSILAEFDSIAPGDTTSRPRARRIHADGDASSYYQIATNEQGRNLPNINYVRGREITVLFDGRLVSTVDVVDRASGVYLEPTTASPPGSAPAAAPAAGIPGRVTPPTGTRRPPAPAAPPASGQPRRDSR
ncbi:MAG TPA: hypothetical protein VM939_12770 [Gemmatimonadaceae bacterium]|nr:hypothetical protein [Gemmatimonadaceae bacterium]